MYLTRELKGLSELYLLPWAEKARQFFLEMNHQKNEDVRSEKTGCGQDLLCQYEIRYDDLVKEGKALLNNMVPKFFRYDPLHCMVNRLENCKDSYLLFIRSYEAPFTNNEAKRDLRPCKTRQKISGCFRS